MIDQPTPPDETTAPDHWDAIAGFLAGEGSAGDSADLRQWLTEHPADAHVVASLEKLLPTTASGTSGEPSTSAGLLAFGRPVDVEAALRQVHAKMETAPLRATFSAERARRPQPLRLAAPRAAPRSWSRTLWAVAAVLVGAVGLIQSRSRPQATSTTAAVTYNTAVGASQSVTLADGSQVMLDAGSRLVVSANYGQKQREVELQGAGRFTVKHDEANPFVVRVGSAIVRDLGTMFTVKSVNNAVMVTVTEGAVTLSDSAGSRRGQAVDLRAGDRGRLLANGLVVSERGTVTPDEAAWVVGKLVYRDAPLAEVQADLRRWYGVELVVADSTLRGYSVKTDILPGEPISSVVARLGGYMGAVATTRGDTVFLDRPGERVKR